MEPMTSTEQPAARTSRVASRETRRRQLIEATIASIAELGLNDTTLRTVTMRAGLSHGTINFHFRSKELLLIETLRFLAEEHRARWRAAVASAGPRPERQLAKMIEVDFDPVICNERRLAVWFAFWGEIKCRPLYLDLCGSVDAERLGEFERLCGRLGDDGGYRDIRPARTARSLQSMIDGIWLNMHCQPEAYANGEAMQMCLSFLAGCFPRHFPLDDASQDGS